MKHEVPEDGTVPKKGRRTGKQIGVIDSNQTRGRGVRETYRRMERDPSPSGVPVTPEVRERT